MKQCMDSENLHRRLKRIAGQISGLERLIDEDVPCEEILIQVNAIKSAIHKVGQIILVGHINHCVKDGIEHGDADKTLAEFAEVLEQYSKI
ncbi:MAG: metal-sensing transcriptional repressor [Candidatus Methanomethylophilaceae archaeon]|nr:metal-sensing transcriptional repressor [Candidatus Methanomethylophilaceae archaeon]